ncbi:SAM-dependent methyltransferase [Pseudonocardia xishanensis]|uniref:Uncharacterized protein n=1 Tax=Pseudonocardia xishanensis TaxID=630995 RepID=A0ABP8S1S0_9PSEU
MTTTEHPTNRHYDLDPRVFGLFLDESRKYSSGWYLTPEDSLETAQQQKMSMVADLVCHVSGHG